GLPAARLGGDRRRRLGGRRQLRVEARGARHGPGGHDRLARPAAARDPRAAVAAHVPPLADEGGALEREPRERPRGVLGPRVAVRLGGAVALPAPAAGPAAPRRPPRRAAA